MVFPILYDKLRIKKVLIVVPLHREGLTSFLSPLLGQYGIRNVDFVTTFASTFNAKTLNIFSSDIVIDDLEAGLSDELLSIPVYLSIYKNGKYTLDTGYPAAGSLFNMLFKKRRRFYRGKTLYRNFKKLFQLSTFLRYIEVSLLPSTSGSELTHETTPLFSFNDVHLQLCYDHVRNSLHRKR